MLIWQCITKSFCREIVDSKVRERSESIVKYVGNQPPVLNLLLLLLFCSALSTHQSHQGCSTGGQNWPVTVLQGSPEPRHVGNQLSVRKSQQWPPPYLGVPSLSHWGANLTSS